MANEPGAKGSVAKRAGMIAVLATATALLATSPAAAASSLDGSCAVSGKLEFDPPLGNEPRPTSFRDQASGTCTGSLNGVPQVDAPVVIRGRGSGTLSCFAGRAMNLGRLIFTRGTKNDADDVKIDFVAETTGGLLEFVGTFRGAVSGTGIAHVNFLPYADESGLAACESGELASARYDLFTRTVSPLVG
jgi:hypothetical protein